MVSTVTGQQVPLIDFSDEDGEIEFLKDRVIKVAFLPIRLLAKMGINFDPLRSIRGGCEFHYNSRMNGDIFGTTIKAY